MENFSFKNFEIQFGEDEKSDLNRILRESVINFNIAYIDFSIGIVDKKLQPFDILNKLIRVKKINLYLKVHDNDGDVVSIFKMEDCNFLRISNFQRFLNGFSSDIELRKESTDMYRIRVDIDIEKIYSNEIVLYKKESKNISDLEALFDGETKMPKKKGSEWEKATEWEKEKAVDPGYGNIRLGGVLVGTTMIDNGDNGIRYATEEKVERAERAYLAQDRVYGEILKG